MEQNRIKTEHGVPILYEDNHLLVVEKPVNMPVQADMSGDLDLLTELKAYIKQKYDKPGEAYLGLCHRLDRPVGGVMVFARTSKAASRLTEQFASHTAKKRYLAIVSGEAKASDTLTDYLVKDEATFSSRVAAKGEAGAKEARLSYDRLARDNDSGESLLDVRLYTGRPHQIRVQLTHAGLPIKGDQRYGKNAQVGTQICLFAYALTICHPTLKEEMTFCLRPKDASFARFDAQMALLPAFRVCRGIFVDAERIVVDKNAGAEVEKELTAELASLFGAAYPVHRLDANTEGVVLFARSEAAQKRYAEMFRKHELRKIYHCVVCGAPPKNADRLVHWLKKDADAARVSLCSESDAGAQRCELSYRVLTSNAESSLLEIELYTGRTHQIRVQMAAIGCPVLGDDAYGDRALNKEQRVKTQRLLAKRLEIDGQIFESERELSL